MTHEEEQEFLISETEWIREIAGEPDWSAEEFICWTMEDARITAIIRECSSGYGFQYVEYGVRTSYADTKRFRYGEYIEMRRLIYSTFAERGNELAAAALEALGPEENEE